LVSFQNQSGGDRYAWQGVCIPRTAVAEFEKARTIGVGDQTYRKLAGKHGLSAIEIECHMWRVLRWVCDCDEKNHPWWQFWRR
jgi:hypothetical protein